MRSLFICAVTALSLVPVLTAQAPPAPGPPTEVFFDSLELTVVNVDVYVTDKKGNRVTGLTIADFEVLEDGKPVEVTNFYAIENRRRVARAPLAAAAPEAMEVPPEPEFLVPDEIPADQRLRLIVYVDNLFLRPFDRNKVARATRTFLRNLVGPGDQVMLATFDRALHIRQGFTADPYLVEAALLDIEELTGYGLQAATERRDVIRRIEKSDSVFEAEGHVMSWAEARYFELRQSVDALKELVGSLAGLPGRKALLYVSNGLPMTPGEDLFFLLDEEFGGRTGGQLTASRYRARNMLRELTAQANANRVSFYTLEAAGLRGHSSLSAENTSAGGSRIQVDAVRATNLQTSLAMMARDTGGLAAYNTNNYDGALRNLAADIGSYYSLGYSPVHAREGRYHQLEVKVKGRGLVVRHRDGYRDKDPETRLNEGTVATLLYGGESNPWGVQVETETPRRGNDGKLLVPLLVKIPIGAIVLAPADGWHRGRTKVSVAVIDDDGRVSKVTISPVPIDIPDADIEVAHGKHFTYAAELYMNAGQHRIAVGVYDELGGETCFLSRRVDIGG